jgi:prepilin-type N-terminal cleavage/methylation domain-containing protein
VKLSAIQYFPWCISRDAAEKRAFTLVEILVSLVALSVIVVLVSLLLNAATKTITSSGKHMNADSQARLILNRMAIDFSNMVQRTDIDYSSFKQPSGTLSPQYNNSVVPANLQTANAGNPGNDQCAFYAKGVGYFSSGSTPPASASRGALTLVGYNMAVDPYFNGGQRPVLQRIGKGLGWESDPAGSYLSLSYLPVTLTGQWPSLFSSDPDWKTVGDQVFRFEYNYLLKPNYSSATTPYPSKLSNTPYWDSTTNKMMPTNPHTCINGFQDVAAIVVSIAVLDSTSGVIVSNSNTALEKSLPDAVEGADIRSSWLTIINSSTFAKNAGIPQEAASAVRVYERYIYLAPPQ